jgi:hypothetical protein
MGYIDKALAGIDTGISIIGSSGGGIRVGLVFSIV